MEVVGAVSVSATTEIVLFSFWTHQLFPLLAWGGGGAGLCIYMPQAQRQKLYLNQSAVVMVPSYSSISHSGGSPLRFLQSLVLVVGVSILHLLFWSSSHLFSIVVLISFLSFLRCHSLGSHIPVSQPSIP